MSSWLALVSAEPEVPDHTKVSRLSAGDYLFVDGGEHQNLLSRTMITSLSARMRIPHRTRTHAHRGHESASGRSGPSFDPVSDSELSLPATI
jgi:hypothetical protein